MFTAKRHFLIGGIIAALVLPLVEFTKITYLELPRITSEAASLIIPISEGITQPEFTAIPWWQLLLLIYAAGILVLGVRLVVQLFSLLKLISTNNSVRRGRFTFVQVQDQMAPFSFFNYIVYNPLLHNERDLKMILQHEKVHASQWHSLDILLISIVRTLQWINPFAWFFKKKS